MADTDRKLRIIIELLKKGVGAQQATNELKALDVQQQRSKFSLQSLSAVYKTFAASILGTILIRQLTASVRAFQEQEQAIAKLNGTLRASGQFTEEYSRQLQQMASRFQDVTRYGDETVLSVQQQLIAFGATSDQIEKLTEVTLDLAEGMGVDLKSAAQLMGKALAGEFSTLSRYGIFVDENATDSQKLAQAIAQIEKRFGGLARAAAATSSGALTQAKNAFGDLQEIIGEVSLELIGGAEGIAAITQKIKEMGAVIQSLKEGPQAMLYRQFSEGLAGTVKDWFPGSSSGGKNIESDEEAARRKALDLQVQQLAIAIEYRATNDEIGYLYAQQNEELTQVNNLMNEANVAWEKHAKIKQNLRTAQDAELQALKQAIDLEKQRAEATKASQAQMQWLSSDIGRITEDGKRAFSYGLSGAIIDFTSGVKSAREAFSDFGREFLQTMADMILQMAIYRAVSGALGAVGLNGPGGFSTGGMAPSKFAMGGVSRVDSATYFPKFNAVAGEAGSEFLTVLRNPKMLSLGGMPAAVGSIGQNRLALVNFQQAKNKFAQGGVAGELPGQFSALAGGGGAGGSIRIMIQHSKESEVRIIGNSVKNAEVRITQSMGEDSDLSRATKRLTT